MKIMDIHSHTYFSACGADKHEDTINAAINGGIQLFGISDHCYGIGERREEYIRIIDEMKNAYNGKIQLLCGIEIATVPGLGIDDPKNVKGFEYCLIEHIDRDESTVGMNIFDYADGFDCKVGIAHTDLIGMAVRKGLDPTEFLSRFADHGIFWEMNVNYDSIHGFSEHQYMLDFLNKPDITKIVKDSGIKLSVGFDGHRVYDYDPERVIRMNKFIHDSGIEMVSFG